MLLSSVVVHYEDGNKRVALMYGGLLVPEQIVSARQKF